MTAREQVQEMVRDMPDEGIELLLGWISSMPSGFLKRQGTEKLTEADLSRRIGAGKGLITDPEDFDKWDEEIAELFEKSAL